MRDVEKFLLDGYNDQTSVNKNNHLLEDWWNKKDTDSEEKGI